MVELVERRTVESDVSGSNVGLDSYFYNRNQFFYMGGQGFVEAHALHRQVGETSLVRWSPILGR